MRSYRGRCGSWFSHALQRHEGRIRAGGIERDVTFEESDGADHGAIIRSRRDAVDEHRPDCQPLLPTGPVLA